VALYQKRLETLVYTILLTTGYDKCNRPHVMQATWGDKILTRNGWINPVFLCFDAIFLKHNFFSFKAMTVRLFSGTFGLVRQCNFSLVQNIFLKIICIILENAMPHLFQFLCSGSFVLHLLLKCIKW